MTLMTAKNQCRGVMACSKTSETEKAVDLISKMAIVMAIVRQHFAAYCRDVSIAKK